MASSINVSGEGCVCVCAWYLHRRGDESKIDRIEAGSSSGDGVENSVQDL